MRELPPATLLRNAVLVLVGTAVWAASSPALAQFGGPGADTRSARERALIDITGQWVAVVNEDWRWRMMTPPVGDTASIPLNSAGRAATAEWDRERDVAEGNLCRAFGAPGLIRQPTRIRISWEDDETLRLEFDAGRQVRRFEFEPSGAPSGLSLQGRSEASWYRQPQSRGVLGGGGARSGGALHVQTTGLSPGYLRPNGVPYSEQATMKEYFHTFTLPGDGGSWLIVTTLVDDPVYLTTQLVLSTQFRKEERRSGWNPRACEIAPPADGPAYVPGPFG